MVVQRVNTSAMIFPVRETVSFLSRLMTLQPGDIIATGPTSLKTGQGILPGSTDGGRPRQSISLNRGFTSSCHTKQPHELPERRHKADRLARHYACVVLSVIALATPEHDPTIVRAALWMVTQTESERTRGIA